MIFKSPFGPAFAPSALRRGAVLVGVILGLSACAYSGEITRNEAEYSPWKLALKRTHTWRVGEESRFETLELLVDPQQRDKDLAIDGQAVIGEYVHGGETQCARPHRVDGTLRLVELGASQVRTRIDARLHCPGEDPVPLKGDFVFDVKTPP